MSVEFPCQCGPQQRQPIGSDGDNTVCATCGKLVDPSVDPFANIVDDTDMAAEMRVAKAAAARRRELESKALQYGYIPPKIQPKTAIAPPDLPGRPYRYLVLLLTLLPLVWATLKPAAREPISKRIEVTAQNHPEVKYKLKALPQNASEDELFNTLPNGKLDGALLPHDTYLHWAFAAASAVLFLVILLTLFPAGYSKLPELLKVGGFTGTAGILLLLGFQWAAFHMPLFTGGGITTILLDMVWAIGQSYRMALGDHGLFASVVGFTAGVGFCEEACKALPLIYIARTSHFSRWQSAMILGLISGVGFGISEAITYSHDYYNGILGPQIYLVRFVSCVALHAIWAAATGINVFRRQSYFRGNLHALEWIFQVLITVSVPMVLHGLYDTLLKQEYDLAALMIAFASFGWLTYQIELAKRKLGRGVQSYVF